MLASTRSFDTPALSGLHIAFLALLPRLVRHARIQFRDVRCPATKDDLIQEMIALSWAWFVTLTRRGKDPSHFPAAFARLAALAVRGGRSVCGQAPTQDVLSPRAQQRRGFSVHSLPDGKTSVDNGVDKALADSTQPPVPEQVALRADFACWRSTHKKRDRQLLDDLLAGDSTRDAARRHGLSTARINQLRHAFHNAWRAFSGDAPDDGSTTSTTTRPAHAAPR